jgi:aryl-alcohol dehydrogenase-like predicted oxidoreductase
MSKLALGTAQFGQKYGIANKIGQINVSEIDRILQLAKEENIDLIDTSITYGDSEKIIGEAVIKDFKFVTKLPPVPQDCKDLDAWVKEKIQSSLSRLGTKSLYGLLINSSENLLNDTGKKLINAINKVKINGFVKKIGISVYDPSECEQIMRQTRIDIVQAPLNLVDQRLITSGWLSRLHSEEIEIHTRSVFLQGLLLMPRNNIPNIFNRWSRVWDQWTLELERNKLSAVGACLLYPLSFPEINRVIVGVDNSTQLNSIINSSKSHQSKIDWSFMSCNDEMLINPTNWYN